MKRIKTIFCVMTVMMSVHFSHAQSVDEIIGRYVDSLGGDTQLQALKTVRMEGAMEMMGTEISLVITKSHLIGYRVDISAGGQDGYQIYTPTKGWNYLPFQGQTTPVAMVDEQLKTGLSGIDIQGNLYKYKEKGNLVVLNGKETLDGKECYKVKATLKSGKLMTYFIDGKSFHIVKVSSMVNVQGTEKESATTFSNYKKTPEGFIFPFTSVSERGEITYSKIEANKPVDEKIFLVNGQ